MTPNGILQIVVYFLLILAIAKPMGVYMTKVFAGERTFLHPVLRPLERLCYAAGGVKESVEQRWTQYAASLLAFSIFSFLILYLLQRLQGYLPLNPMGFGTAHAPSGATAMTPDLAFNTAASFTTNTNWQNYSGESTLSYLVQMLGLTMHNFTSAAAGHRDRGGADPRIRAAAGKRDREFLGGPGSGYGICADPAVDRHRTVVLLAGGDSERASLYSRDDAGRKSANHRAGAGGVAGSDQDAGDEWRWIFRGQLGASV